MHEQYTIIHNHTQSYTISAETYAKVVDTTGLTFNADLNGIPFSNIPTFQKVRRYQTLKEVLSADLVNETCLINAPREKAKLILQYYNSVKALLMDKVQAVILVPANDLGK